MLHERWIATDLKVSVRRRYNYGGAEYLRSRCSVCDSEQGKRLKVYALILMSRWLQQQVVHNFRIYCCCDKVVHDVKSACISEPSLHYSRLTVLVPKFHQVTTHFSTETYLSCSVLCKTAISY